MIITNCDSTHVCAFDFLNADKITVKYEPYVAARRKPERIQACRNSNNDPSDTGAAL